MVIDIQVITTYQRFVLLHVALVMVFLWSYWENKLEDPTKSHLFSLVTTNHLT